ncbi:MAG: hypothetical protein IT424_11880 [Pirellulales bacterium]|nr:hypothetical protein [Pirellulales bacterium]
MNDANGLPPFDALPDADQRAFIARRATARQFPAGTLLYKFTQYGLVGPGGRITPWWSGVEPLAPGDPGLAGALDRAARLGHAAKDYARARSAVTNQWNSMEGLLVIRLVRPASGYVGRCAHQPLDENPQLANVVWIGGAWQAYLPGLSSADATVCRPPQA